MSYGYNTLETSVSMQLTLHFGASNPFDAVQTHTGRSVFLQLPQACGGLQRPVWNQTTLTEREERLRPGLGQTAPVWLTEATEIRGGGRGR